MPSAVLNKWGAVGVWTSFFGGRQLPTHNVGQRKMLATAGMSLLAFNLQANELPKTQTMETIDVVGQHSDQAILDSGFNVDVLLVEEFKSGNYDVVEILERSPGINVRKNGGLGAEFNLALNGLSGNQIRYFFDGVPMEDFGAALSFPANLVEKIEVFKGVVPVQLGADALGGAVNITTPDLAQDLADVSYTYGSFNTHKGTVFLQQQVDDYFVRLAANAEHSDNDYWMNSVNQTDALGNVLGQQRVRRFHDQYSSGMLNIKSGVLEKWYADELSLAVTSAKSRNNEQHPEKTTNVVYGKYYSENDTQLISANYRKRFDQWGINAYLLTGQVETVFSDEASRKYTWSGDYTLKPDSTQGELSDKSRFTLEDEVIRGRVGGQYFWDNNNSLNLNLTYDETERRGHDSLNANNRAFSTPNWIRKSVFAAAWDSKDLVSGLDINLFAKNYLYKGEINARTLVGFEYRDEQTDVNIDKFGYGSAASYQANDNLLFKASYERAYRLPQAQEILGTGQYVKPNPELQPEQSDNVNLGAKFEIDGESTMQMFEANLFYRDSIDFIYYYADQVVYGLYTNKQNVETRGIEASYYLNLFGGYSLQLNATYQDLINRSRVDKDGDLDRNYGKRMPNEPYLFANARLSSDFELEGNALTLMWTTSFVEQFYLHWADAGDKSTKHQIPSHITHDLDLTLSPGDGDYQFTLSARNLLDERVFDNYKIEKPGRAIYLKFRYLY